MLFLAGEQHLEGKSMAMTPIIRRLSELNRCCALVRKRLATATTELAWLDDNLRRLAAQLIDDPKNTEAPIVDTTVLGDVKPPWTG